MFEQKIVKKVFPIKTYESSLNFDHDFPHQYRKQTIINSWQFIFGESTEVEHTTTNKHISYTNLPLTAFDIVKHAIVSFTPTLNFGWLKPEYSIHEVPQTIVHHKTYVNVIPLETYDNHRERVYFLMSEPEVISYKHRHKLQK
jgi:hypothetical protein